MVGHEEDDGVMLMFVGYLGLECDLECDCNFSEEKGKTDPAKESCEDEIVRLGNGGGD